jgi:putative transposase
VIAALTDAVTRYPRWGFWKLFDRLRVEGRPWNHKRVHRVYCALRLNLPRRTTRPVPRRIRQALTAPPVLNQTWALDFMTETLYDGRRVRLGATWRNARGRRTKRAPMVAGARNRHYPQPWRLALTAR